MSKHSVNLATTFSQKWRWLIYYQLNNLVSFQLIAYELDIVIKQKKNGFLDDTFSPDLKKLLERGGEINFNLCQTKYNSNNCFDLNFLI